MTRALSRTRRRPSDSGTASLEFVAMLPFFSIIAALALQAFTAITVAAATEDAARAAARAATVGQDPQDAAEDALPGWLAANVEDVDIDTVGMNVHAEVDVSVPVLLSAFTGTTATGQATMARQLGTPWL